MTNTQGWVGDWSPGIGDPTIAGWMTVAIYALTAWMAYRVLARVHGLKPWLGVPERRLWWGLLLGLLFLGVNKQLDLQSALTELGRMWAHAQGWYEDRQRVQLAVIAGVGVLGLTLCLLLLRLSFQVPGPTVLALLGSVGLVVFVVTRAMSFHHVDAFINWKLWGVRMNVMIENGALLLIAVGACLRARGAV